VKSIFFQSLIIIAASAILGFSANALNPNGVKIGARTGPGDTKSDTTFSVLQDEPPDEPLVIGKTKIKSLMNNDNIVLIDARLPEEYEQGHMPGAVNIPFERLGRHIEQMDALPKDKWLVCYCGGPPCDLGELLAYELFNMGYQYVAIYQAGLDDWKKSEDVEL